MGRRKLLTSELLKPQKTLTKVFNQRKDGIMKKAFELSTLCDVQVGVIIYGQNSDSPIIWPKDEYTLTQILIKYLNTSFEERRKRATDVSCFIKKNDEVNMIPEINPLSSNRMFDYFTVEQLKDLVCSLDSKIEAVNAKINVLKNNQNIDLPKFEEVLLQSDYYGYGGLQQLNDVVHLPELPCAVNDHYTPHQLLDQQVYEDELMMMMMMMMMNGENNCSNFNSNNSEVGDFYNLVYF